VDVKLILAGAASVIALWAGAGASAAAPMDSPKMPSDQNLRYTRAYVERAYDMLSHDQSDYGGHRVAAMNDIAQARTDLTAALHYDRNPEDAVIPKAALPQDTELADWERGQKASDKNIDFVRKYVERAIDMLQHDAHDYGGYRAKAVAALEAARSQLAAAIAYRDAHRDSHEPRGVASDENLRYARLYVERAADMLQHDAHDYHGHRAAATADILKARADLAAALRYDSNHEDATMPAHVMPGDESLDTFYLRGDRASDKNIAFVRRYVERAIDMLQRDKHDYHGYRVKAIGDLESAVEQLNLALRGT
jgi:hypothetical protein